MARAWHELPLLFRPGCPMALQHDELLENNIHVDEVTGRITGIVDWADAVIAPFGVSLSGLETLLGVTSWHFHSRPSWSPGAFLGNVLRRDLDHLGRESAFS